MSTNIGPYEIVSELAKSPIGAVYKANDPQSGQTVALKTIQLSAFGESASALEQALLEEAERVKVLSSQNIMPLLSASAIDGQFCAAMEYVQGNSIATMLARKEGFSIWDLLDIGRQVCGGLDHAASKDIVHSSLEPGKIMCGWDGTVRILGYGVSSVGNFVQHVAAEGVPTILQYMSPEQLQGQPTDLRSNLFSLGAIFYEMVTERKAFDAQDADSLRQAILEGAPVPPIQVSGKVHPLLSDLIIKALAKDPAQRYQSGRELLTDLEKCKESRPAAKKPEAPKPAAAAPAAPKTIMQPKAAAPAAPKAPSAPKPAAAPKPVQSGLARPAGPLASAAPKSTLATPKSTLATPKTAAAAAGVGSAKTTAPTYEPSEIDLSDHVSAVPSAKMSSAGVANAPELETFEAQSGSAPKITVDPMMAESGPSGAGGTSFSEISELPPLKEVYVAPAPPPAAEDAPEMAAPAPRMPLRSKPAEKPKVQAREAAQKAIKEIKGVPPKLMLYSIGGAVALILAIGIGIYVHVLNSDDDIGGGKAASVAAASAAQPVQSAPTPAQAAPDVAAPQAEQAPAEIAQPEQTPEQAAPRSRNGRRKAAAPVAVAPGQLVVDSTPQGAQVQLDGQSDATWVTPFALTGVQPGQHTITFSKSGYTPSSRTVTVASGARATATTRLTQLMATLIVKSNPAGANVYVDGRDTGAKTPAQVSVDKGSHLVLVRKSGYLDETMNGQFALGQTLNFAPTLRSLGNIDSIRTVGKMSKLFGKGGDSSQGKVSIHTQPKGAQIALNQRMLDKNSPVDIMIDPGNYVLDITLSGYAPIHKIITVDQGGKLAVDEVMQRE